MRKPNKCYWCTLRTNIEQTEKNAKVAAIISAMAKRQDFVAARKVNSATTLAVS